MKIKNERKSLQVFCDKDEGEGFFELYKRPYFNEADGGRLIATDGIVVLIADQKLLRGKYPSISQRLPDFFSNYDMEVGVTFDAVESAMNKFTLIPEKVSRDCGSSECPECDGTGKVEWEYTDKDGHTHYREEECPVCCGTGEREEFEWVETGRMLLPEHAVFNLCGSLLKASRLMECVEAFRKMGFGKMVLRKQNAHGENVFEVCDGMMFVMMSRRPSDDDVSETIETGNR